MKVLQACIVSLFILFMISALILMSAKRDEEAMKVQYCWDSNGEHYVFPDERCTH